MKACSNRNGSMRVHCAWDAPTSTKGNQEVNTVRATSCCHEKLHLQASLHDAVRSLRSNITVSEVSRKSQQKCMAHLLIDL